jgi:energy-coupling factor transporter ATP-binding protein EcfA2
MLFASNVLAECEFRPKMLKYNDPHLEAEKIISTIGIKEFIDRDPNSLSGGQQRLVSLAAGLSGLPQSIVVDEPEFALDPYYRTKIWQLLRQIADNGHAVLVITHDLDNIALYVDWIAFVFNGEIIKQGEKISDLMTDNTVEKFLNIPSFLSTIGRSVEFSKMKIPFVLKDKQNDNSTHKK